MGHKASGRLEAKQAAANDGGASIMMYHHNHRSSKINNKIPKAGKPRAGPE
jgi:hypothetical protein